MEKKEKEELKETTEEDSEEAPDLEVDEKTLKTDEELENKKVLEVREIKIVAPGVYEYKLISNSLVWNIGQAFVV